MLWTYSRFFSPGSNKIHNNLTKYVKSLFYVKQLQTSRNLLRANKWLIIESSVFYLRKMKF